MLRNKIRNEIVLRMVMKRLAESVTKPISYNRIANLVRGTGMNTSAVSVIQYVEFAREAFVIFPVENYASRFVEKETIKKHYFIDNGLLSIFLFDTLAPLLENVCAIHLYRKYGDKLYFYNRNVEVDFYVPAEKLAMQVCASLRDEETREREVGALIKLDSLERLERMLILTRDEEDTIEISGGKAIEIVPVYKWLLMA